MLIAESPTTHPTALGPKRIGQPPKPRTASSRPADQSALTPALDLCSPDVISRAPLGRRSLLMMRLMALFMVYAVLLGFSAWLILFMRDSLPGFVSPNAPAPHPNSHHPSYEGMFR